MRRLPLLAGLLLCGASPLAGCHRPPPATTAADQRGAGSSAPPAGDRPVEPPPRSAPSPPMPRTPPPPSAASSGAGQGEPCGEGRPCERGLTCIQYYGVAGPSGPQLASCEIPCLPRKPGCPAGQACTVISDGPGAVCRIP